VLQRLQGVWMVAKATQQEWHEAELGCFLFNYAMLEAWWLGHSRQVHAGAFHPDGSLAGSAGLDAFGEQLEWE
jgi:hypothetical protein